MAVKVTVHQVTADTGGGTQTFAHGHGTTPDAALFFVTKNSVTLPGSTDHAIICVGMSDGTTDGCHGIQSEHNQETGDTGFWHRNNCAIRVCSDGNETSDDGRATCSFDATNVSLGWDSTPGEAFHIEAVVLSGTAGCDVNQGDFNGTATITHTHNLGLTTTDDALIFSIGSIKCTTQSGNNHGADAGFGFGVASWNGSAFTERGFSFMEDNGETDGRPAAYLDTSNIYTLLSPAYAIWKMANLDNFATNSFTLDITDASTQSYAVTTLIVGLPSSIGCYVGTVDAPTATGSTEYSPLSFEPQYVGLLTTQIETLDSIRQDGNGDEAGAFGFANTDGTTEAACAVAVENDAATTNTECSAADEFIYMPADDGTLTASAAAGNGARATLTSLDNDGWTINAASANSTQTKWVAWAIQAEPSGGVTVTPSAADGGTSSTAPSALYGSLSLTPGAADSSAVSTDPSVLTPAGLVVSPSLSASTASSTAPSVLFGSLTVTPALAASSATSEDPAVIEGGGLIVVPQASTAGTSTVAPSVLDSFAVQPSGATAAGSTTAPSVLFGPLTVTPAVAAGGTDAFEITVLGGAFMPRYDLSGIESEDDRDGLMIDSGETLTHNSTDYTVLAAELDGQTLDKGTSVDGIIDILIKCSDIVSGGIAEHDAVTYNGASYTISKIEEFGGGISVMYLD